eukprot:TRINITY_DN2007_c0_g1_i2.p3 TRINITY_DN2007_c0_g1~~TRINITY_DN2007_c0_g1_i2.p3  ORF type:complete len:173 (+),score=24.98 TRINITY_DN2007_c0_g1_i2:205-723(+)
MCRVRITTPPLFGHAAKATRRWRGDVQGENNDTALTLACSEGLEQVARLLIDKGAALDVQGESNDTALIWACSKGLEEVARLLIAKGAALDVQGDNNDTALIWACREGHEEVARLLIEKGAATDIDGNDAAETALSVAQGAVLKDLASPQTPDIMLQPSAKRRLSASAFPDI